MAGVITVALEWPNTATKEQRGPSNVAVRVEKTPEPVRLKRHDRAVALKVVSTFIDTAVARKNIDRSWNLVAPEFRAGVTRKQWDAGEMPVAPYPIKNARWKFQYSDDQGVGFSVALFPTEASHQRAQVFLVGLHKLGSGKGQHWVIDNWQSTPAGGPQNASVGGGGALDSSSPAVNSFGKATESAAWLLLPLGLLSLVIFVPVGVASVNWYRGHRAERALLRS